MFTFDDGPLKGTIIPEKIALDRETDLQVFYAFNTSLSNNNLHITSSNPLEITSKATWVKFSDYPIIAKISNFKTSMDPILLHSSNASSYSAYFLLGILALISMKVFI